MGFRVWGLGFGVWGLGLRASRLRLSGWGLGFGVLGLGLHYLPAGFDLTWPMHRTKASGDLSLTPMLFRRLAVTQKYSRTCG